VSDADHTHPMRADAAPASSPTSERYELLEQLGEGAMGVVWRAHDRALDRKVALKLLHDDLLAGEHQERMAREARAMARLAHPNVVAVHDVGTRDGRTYLTMELVSGQPLSRWLRTPRGWPEVVALFRGVAAGLAAAHAAGVVHRDVKPSNILVGDDGRAKIADFGVAHTSAAAPGLDAVTISTGTGGVIGTPIYMAPECLSGEAADPRSDQFGCCAALYEALHGVRPFESTTLVGLALAIGKGPPGPVREVPGWLHAICTRGLAADPAARFSSMEALAAALDGPPRRAGRLAATIAGAGLVAALGVTALVVVGPGAPSSGVAVEPDAAAVIDVVAAVVADAGVVAVADAATAADAAAAPAAAPDAGAPPRRRSKPKLTAAEAKARYDELVAAAKQASAANQFEETRRLAEQAVPFAAGDTAALGMAAVASCRLYDEKRARKWVARIHKGDHRRSVIQLCWQQQIDLSDLR
jgi:eukaryotic-like serine/threonine-protein kinase